jgi:hypothetical protein
MMRFFYKIYGLQISSSRQISILADTLASPADIAVDFMEGHLPDLDLQWQQISTPALEVRETISLLTAETSGGMYTQINYQLRIGRMSLRINPGKSQVWISFESITYEDIESFFVGTIMGAILRLRDQLCLHASVVVINGKAVAFLGQKRSGKSTTAAAFARLGYQVLADDIAVIKEKDHQFYIQPGYPRLRLRPKTVEVMYAGEASDLPMVNSWVNSRYADITDQFYTDPLPIAALFILSAGETGMIEPAVEPLSLSHRLVHLGKNTFANYVITPQNRKTEFELLARLAIKIPVNKLKVVYEITKADQQCEAVLNYLN